MSEPRDVLIVEDEAPYRRVLTRELERRGHRVRSVGSAEEGLEILAEFDPDVVLLDLNMPGAGGLTFLEQVRARSADAEVIIVTGYPHLDSAVEGLRHGAYDYLSKPVDLETLNRAIDHAGERRALQRENEALRTALAPRGPRVMPESRDERMQAIVAGLPRIATSPSTVLIHGETGTGKDLLAREIHRLSPRSREPLVVIDCGALQGSVRASELFGHERGAFTGADRARPGLFEAAHHGTVFLDEVAELDADSQASLLRVLENAEVRRVGATHSRKIDVRVLAATNRELATEVQEGRFREDLFYRLQVVQLDLPPLRERQKDIPDLFQLFLQRYRPEPPVPVASEEVLEVFGRYPWPGNVRELRNAAEMLAVTVEGATIDVRDLPFRLVGGASAPAPGVPGEVQPLSEIERRHILSVYEHTGHNKKKTAELLGISLRTLYNRLTEYGEHSGSGDEEGR